MYSRGYVPAPHQRMAHQHHQRRRSEREHGGVGGADNCMRLVQTARGSPRGVCLSILRTRQDSNHVGDIRLHRERALRCLTCSEMQDNALERFPWRASPKQNLRDESASNERHSRNRHAAFGSLVD
jgi:hypothetical protein